MTEAAASDLPFPSYMSNTETSRAKARSQSAPRQRAVAEALERQLSSRKGAEHRNVLRGTRMQRSLSQHQAGSAPRQSPFFHRPWSSSTSVRLDTSTASLKDSECGSTTSSVLTAATIVFRHFFALSPLPNGKGWFSFRSRESIPTLFTGLPTFFTRHHHPLEEEGKELRRPAGRNSSRSSAALCFSTAVTTTTATGSSSRGRSRRRVLVVCCDGGRRSDLLSSSLVNPKTCFFSRELTGQQSCSVQAAKVLGAPTTFDAAKLTVQHAGAGEAFPRAYTRAGLEKIDSRFSPSHSGPGGFFFKRLTGGPYPVCFLWLVSPLLQILGDRARSFADDLARYLPGGAGDARADLARLSDELLRLKVTAADVEHARRRPSDPALTAWIHRLRDATHDADDLLDDIHYGRLADSLVAPRHKLRRILNFPFSLCRRLTCYPFGYLLRSYRSRNLSTFPTTEISDVANKMFTEYQFKRCRNYLKMPTLIIDEKEKESASFVSKNGLIEDPVSVDKERSVINPWTHEEKEVFMQMLASFGKNFSKISNFLQHKTTDDCVEFYYKHHKRVSFREVKKLMDLRQQQPTSNYLGSNSGKKRNPENAASLDMLGSAA
ncbi:Nuclear receptor corepressor 1 [Hordeum vulgare]|nr:Nuclear receptor corepressor 1 [Hordeum vulgare]